MTVAMFCRDCGKALDQEPDLCLNYTHHYYFELSEMDKTMQRLRERCESEQAERVMEGT